MRKIIVEVPDKCGPKCPLSFKKDFIQFAYYCPYSDELFYDGRVPVKACREAGDKEVE